MDPVSGTGPAMECPCGLHDPSVAPMSTHWWLVVSRIFPVEFSGRGQRVYRSARFVLDLTLLTLTLTLTCRI